MTKKNKTNNSSTTTKTSASWSFQKVLDFFAYIGTACIAIALIFGLAFGGTNVGNAFNTIGQCIAYIISMIMAAFWVRRKRQIGWLIAYIVFVVVIVVMYILNIAL